MQQRERVWARVLARIKIDVGFLALIVIAVAAGAAVLVFKGVDTFLGSLDDDAVLIAAIAPKVVAAMLLAAWLTRLAPPEAIARVFGREAGWRGVALAAGAGAAVPGGPMSSYPLAVAFARAGADAAAVAGFLGAWFLLSANRTIVWEMAFLPPEIVGWRVLFSIPFVVLIALAARMIGRPRVAPRPAAGPKADAP